MLFVAWGRRETASTEQLAIPGKDHRYPSVITYTGLQTGAYHNCSESSGMIVFPLKESENKVTNTIFFILTVDACAILNWKLGRGSLSSVIDFVIFSHSSLPSLVNVLIFDLQSTDDLMSPFNGLLENSRVSYHFLHFIYLFTCSVKNSFHYTR